MDYVYPAFVPLHADSSCLFLLFGTWFVFDCFPLLFHHAFFLFFLWLIGPFIPAWLIGPFWAAILHFFSYAFVYIPIYLSSIVLNSGLLYLVSYPVDTPVDIQQKKKKKEKKKGGGGWGGGGGGRGIQKGDKRRCQNFKLPNV